MAAEGNLDFFALGKDRVAFRSWGQGPDGILCIHGFPTSSFLWRHVAPAMAHFGRVIAPDLPGFGDSELGDRSGTWEEMVLFVDRFLDALGFRRIDLVVHDWGGLIGLRWACDRPDRVGSLVITNTGFFPDGKWHAAAKIMREPVAGESFIDSFTPDLFAAALRAVSPKLEEEAITEYWKCLATPERRAAKLVLYRSGDFAKLKTYDGKLAALARPTVIIWGGDDRFAPAAGAMRLSREIPGAELHILARINHFLQEDAPQTVASLVSGFLERQRRMPA